MERSLIRLSLSSAQPFSPSPLTWPPQALQGAEGGVTFGEGQVAGLTSHLVAKSQGHNGNKESKKGFQLPQP